MARFFCAPQAAESSWVPRPRAVMPAGARRRTSPTPTCGRATQLALRRALARLSSGVGAARPRAGVTPFRSPCAFWASPSIVLRLDSDSTAGDRGYPPDASVCTRGSGGQPRQSRQAVGRGRKEAVQGFSVGSTRLDRAQGLVGGGAGRGAQARVWAGASWTLLGRWSEGVLVHNHNPLVRARLPTPLLRDDPGEQMLKERKGGQSISRPVSLALGEGGGGPADVVRCGRTPGCRAYVVRLRSARTRDRAARSTPLQFACLLTDRENAARGVDGGSSARCAS